MESLEMKRKLIEQWFKRVREQINLLEYRVRHLDVKTPEKNDYDKIVKELDLQFDNIKILRKVLKNDAFIRGFNFKELN